MVIRVSLALQHKLLAQGIESYLQKQPAIVLVPPAHSAEKSHESGRPAGEEVMLIGLDALNQEAIGQLRARHARHPRQALVVLADFHQAEELLDTMDAGALACVSTTSQIEDVLKAIRSASQGKPYLCQQLAALMLQGVRQKHQATRARHDLGQREEQVLRLVADGYSSKEIARRLDIAPSTVDVHRRNIMRKIGLHKVADLTRFAIRHQMIRL